MKKVQPVRVGILGSRGIPNQYGGFEEFAEHLAVRLSEKGFDIWVYNSHRHPCKDETWNGVNRVMCFDPEHLIGTAGQFIYDLNCISDSRKRNFDILLQLGYTSSSIWHWRLPSSSFVISNMDGLEWKRSKYSKTVQKFLRYAERLAVRHSDLLVADNPAIRQYLQDEYSVDSVFIPYGADIPANNPGNMETANTISLQASDESFHCLQSAKFFLMIARLQPDNHIEEIIRGVLQSEYEEPLLIVGNDRNMFSRYLKKKYSSENIIFAGGIFVKEQLDELRKHSRLYFHGHSAGGTNPSLLEAMAASALICAHDNPFNRQVLGVDAFYFKDADGVAKTINTLRNNKSSHTEFIENNLDKIMKEYTWEGVCNSYEKLFINAMGNPGFELK
jgi:glycosyltransferase involved in cell wall biosynthesis